MACALRATTTHRKKQPRQWMVIAALVVVFACSCCCVSAENEVQLSALEHTNDNITTSDLIHTQAPVSDEHTVANASLSVRERSASAWYHPVAASLLICLTSVVGVFVLSFGKGATETLVQYMTSFAAGCLVGVVVFHLYPEGTEYLSDLGEWVMGTCVLIGIVFALVLEQSLHIMLSSFGVEPCGSHASHHPRPRQPSFDVEKAEEIKPIMPPQAPLPDYTSGHSHASHHMKASPHGDKEEGHGHSHGHHGHSHGHSHHAHHDHHHGSSSLWHHIRPIAWITAAGDFFHAFADGIVLAVAFRSCNTTVGWTVGFGIVLHEVPHRVGDFFIFLRAGMSVRQALIVNFLASLASLFGVILLAMVGSVSTHTLGFLLAAGTGGLLFIAMSELIPPMLDVREKQTALGHLGAFCIGAIVIGLSLLQDVHCGIGSH